MRQTTFRQLAPRPTLEQLLDEQLGEMDQLMARVRGGVRGPSGYDELEEQANAIADGLRAAFRNGRR
ncbi:hypothetical protein [Alteraurantiacibacter palmitatis]|uniref:Uncharacterized protein n=1 Tax=Alteraurantiacibacter palmitatis TaxID=2054628 RepID=A0ABV7E3P1_9SPHN